MRNIVKHYINKSKEDPLICTSQLTINFEVNDVIKSSHLFLGSFYKQLEANNTRYILENLSWDPKWFSTQEVTPCTEIYVLSLTGSTICFVFTEQKLLCTTNQERSIQYIGLGRTNNCVIIQVLFSFNLTFPRTKQRIKHMKETISVR